MATQGVQRIRNDPKITTIKRGVREEIALGECSPYLGNRASLIVTAYDRKNQRAPVQTQSWVKQKKKW